MMLERWNPFVEMRRMEEAMNRRWRNTFWTFNGAEVEGWAIPLDVAEEGDNIVVHASMPGITPEDIQVTVEDNVLTIKAETKAEKEKKEGNYLMRERRSGSFYRALRLPDTVDTDKARTVFENGVLAISFPKVETKKAKKLEVTAPKALEGEKTAN